MNPRYPVYVISKGRWDTRFTSKALERANIPYHIVVEPQEYEEYARVIDPEKIYTLPFSNLGQGSIPARNWVWEHSVEHFKAKRHWILDDNIRYFYRVNRNRYKIIGDGTIFRVAEDFTDRYENVALSGFNYEMFVPKRDKIPPFYLNTRVYSMILINNSLPYRWRGRYNEDTDLSLNCLKAGWCTILFNAFIGCKIQTMLVKGGNTDELYRQDKEFDGRLEMAKSLKEQHPELVKIVWKWNRWQHHVNYEPFKRNRLKLRPDVKIKPGVDEYGMYLRPARREEG